MAGSSAFKPAMSDSGRSVAAAQTDKLPVQARGNQPRSVTSPLRPSQVPVLNETTRRGGSPSSTGGPAYRRRGLRPSQRMVGGAETSGTVGPLPPALRAAVEQMSGLSLAGVRVHRDSGQASRARAHAFAAGADIHLAPGQERHLPHEAWHVVQQKQGRVRPTLEVSGAPVNDEGLLEHEADVMGSKASKVSPLPATVNAPAPVPSALTSPAVVQRVSVESYPLKIDRSAAEPVVSISEDDGIKFVECTDSTSGDYRDAAETELGSIGPFAVLARWKIIPNALLGTGNPFTRSHLIAAQFGGQKKYKAHENVRFFPRDLEHGGWQKAEEWVKEEAVEGKIIVTSDDSESAAGMAKSIIGLIRDRLGDDQVGPLEGWLAMKLQAADYVPSAVAFSYQDNQRGELSINEQWNNLESGLSVSGDPGPVYGAIQDLAPPPDLNVSIPTDLKEQAKPPSRTISSREDLLSLLKSAKFSDNKRRRQITEKLNNLKKIKSDKFGDNKFGENIEKIEEFRDINLKVNVQKDFRTWWEKDLEVDELIP
jgi:hypothetical protein